MDGKKIDEVNEKILNITQDVSWLAYHNTRIGKDFQVMSVKSLILQLNSVQRILEELLLESERDEV